LRRAPRIRRVRQVAAPRVPAGRCLRIPQGRVPRHV